MPEQNAKREQAGGGLQLAIGKTRFSTTWKTTAISWEQLLKKLSEPIRTEETYKEYLNMSKDRQSEIKDVGGFVGGVLKDGKRKKGSVAWRTIITLDADHIRGDFLAALEVSADYACCVYSTHKHTPEHPRYRLVIPLVEPIKADQYEPIARILARDLGIDQFDDTTYEAHRLMYWPSCSKDAEYVFQEQPGAMLNPREILERYEAEHLDWRDPFHWPRSSRETVKRNREMELAGDPTEKPGLIGAFCRQYTIQQAIEKFIPDKYLETDSDSRYSYAEGSTHGGMVVYDSGLFAYSHHESDPAGGQLCNAFDLVRLHLFSDKDPDPDREVHKQPSYKAMQDLVKELPEIREELINRKRNEIDSDFAEDLEEETESGAPKWMSKLELDRGGVCTQTIHNARVVLAHDPKLRGAIAYNEFTHQLTLKRETPWHPQLQNEAGDAWRDSDDAGLRLYLEQAYGLKHRERIHDAVSVVAQRNKFHPVRDYLDGLEWDEIPRVDTLLIDYLSAEDSDYVRTVTRKALVAAIARVLQPGCKFDYMLTLYGPQGIGKSHLIKLLAGKWYSDSVNTVAGKEAYEQLQGAWLLEMAELSATRRAEAEAVKHFISKSEDMFRVAYGRHTQRFPRQCIFIGTTNDAEFLRDRTGNRRFWPVTVHRAPGSKQIFRDLDSYEIGQIWAEARVLWESGESLFLSQELEREAALRQEQHMEDNIKRGQIIEFLNTPLPTEWENMDLDARRRFLHGSDFGGAGVGTVIRERVCAYEILCECLQKDPKYIKPYESREIGEILRALPDWGEHEGGARGRLRFGSMYGLQKAWVRLF